jgi:hypothetical protein
VGKYVTKAQNGFWHSFYFTTGRYPDPLRITERNREVTEQACRYCHTPIVEAIDPVAHARSPDRRPRGMALAGFHAALALQSGAPGEPTRTGADAHTDPQLSCIRCHTYVGHWVR